MEITNEPTTVPSSSSSDPQSSTTTAAAGTYVVQIPKDQVYRVPPDENAAIAASRRPPPSKKKPKSSSSNSCYCCVSVAISIIVVAIIIYLLTFFLQPKNPKFQVTNLLVNHSKAVNTISYQLRLGVRNMDQRSGITFQKGGQASLSYGQREIGEGKFPTLHQDKGAKTTSQVSVALTGSKKDRGKLPVPVQKSLNGTSKAHVGLVLRMNLLARMRVSLMNEGDARLAVVCELVADTLGKGGTKILSQSCLVNR